MERRANLEKMNEAVGVLREERINYDCDNPRCDPPERRGNFRREEHARHQVVDCLHGALLLMQ